MASTTTTPEPTRTTGEIFYFNVSFWNVSGPAYTSVPVTLELLKQFSQLYYPVRVLNDVELDTTTWTHTDVFSSGR